MKKFRKQMQRQQQRLLLPIFLLLLAACGNSPKTTSPETMEVTDMAGRRMTVPRVINRVYVTRPGSLVVYAVAPDLMVNRSLWTTDITKKYFTPAYLQLPYVDGSVEEIVKLKPDIIISYFTVNQKSRDEARMLQEKTGIPVFMADMDMEKFSETFRVLGTLLNRKAQTDRMNGFVNTYLSPIAAKAKTLEESRKVRVYYAEGDRGLNTDPSGSFHSQILEFVGALNVAQVSALSGKGMSAVSIEQILLWNPEIILVWTGMGSAQRTYQYIKGDGLWARVPAVRKLRVYQIPYEPFGWFDRPPGTNRILGTVWTAQLLYPGLYHFDLEKITREFFSIYYHHDLTDQELQEVLHPDPDKLQQEDPSTKKPMMP